MRDLSERDFERRDPELDPVTEFIRASLLDGSLCRAVDHAASKDADSIATARPQSVLYQQRTALLALLGLLRADAALWLVVEHQVDEHRRATEAKRDRSETHPPNRNGSGSAFLRPEEAPLRWLK